MVLRIYNEIFFFIFNDYVNQLKFWNLRNNSSGEVNNLCCDDNKSTYYQVDIPRVIDESIVDYFVMKLQQKFTKTVRKIKEERKREETVEYPEEKRIDSSLCDKS